MSRGRTRNPWTAADDARMRAEFPHVRTLDLARSMGRTASSVTARGVVLGLRKTAEARARITAARDNQGPNAGRFGAGRPPWNKGKGGYALATAQPIGAERRRAGYRQRKVTMSGPYLARWQFVHVLLWEEHRGPVPPGHMVTFRDGDREHITIDNLALVSLADHLARTGVHASGRELFELMHLRGQITQQLNKRKAEA